MHRAQLRAKSPEPPVIRTLGFKFDQPRFGLFTAKEPLIPKMDFWTGEQGEQDSQKRFMKAVAWTKRSEAMRNYSWVFPRLGARKRRNMKKDSEEQISPAWTPIRA
jgi:hypothetical protein